MQKIAIFLRNTETNALDLQVIEVCDDYTKIKSYGSMRKYLEYLYSSCLHSCVEDFKYIDSLSINL